MKPGIIWNIVNSKACWKMPWTTIIRHTLIACLPIGKIYLRGWVTPAPIRATINKSPTDTDHGTPEHGKRSPDPPDRLDLYEHQDRQPGKFSHPPRSGLGWIVRRRLCQHVCPSLLLRCPPLPPYRMV